MKADAVTQAMICEKARLIFEELQKARLISEELTHSSNKTLKDFWKT